MVVPLVGNVPLQPPEAVQELASEALHCNVTDEPMATLLSLAFKLTNGGATTAGVVAVLLVAASPVQCRCRMFVRWNSHRMQRVSRAPPTRVWISMRTQTLSSGCGELNSYASPKIYGYKFFRGVRFLSSAIFEITYSFDISNSPTCRQVQTSPIGASNFMERWHRCAAWRKLRLNIAPRCWWDNCCNSPAT